MGQLGHQQDRGKWQYDKEDAIELIKEAKVVAQKTGTSLTEALKAYEILEMDRRSNILIENGDNIDEQAGGFGDILNSIKQQIVFVSQNIKSNKLL